MTILETSGVYKLSLCLIKAFNYVSIEYKDLIIIVFRNGSRLTLTIALSLAETSAPAAARKHMVR